MIFLDFLFFICQNCAWTKEKEPFGSVFRFSFGDIAQLVEQMTFNHWVQGSSPCVPTKNINRFWSGQSGREPCPRVRHQVDLTSVTQSNRHGCPTAGAPAPCEGIPVSPPRYSRGFPRFFVYFTDCFSSVIAVPSNC